mmetsp:Transcript_81851/g.166775  ORF Transcript_81851/g.166775 Transcript_81851/m.166775 type:complete len:295 (-) Transcript_81851:37-921(-)
MASASPISPRAGGSAWMARSEVALIGPRSSMGSPVTLMIRPRVSGPTGTMMGFPVSVTGMPRAKPSVAPIAMVRTLLSPRCWATSRTTSCCSTVNVFKSRASSGFTMRFLSSAERPARRSSSSVFKSVSWPMAALRPPSQGALTSDSRRSNCQSNREPRWRRIFSASRRTASYCLPPTKSASVFCRALIWASISAMRSGRREISRTYSLSGEYTSTSVVTRRAFRIGGTSLTSSNSTSTTAPITCDTRPVAVAVEKRRAAGRAAARKTEDSILSGRVNTLKRPTSDVNDNRLRL